MLIKASLICFAFLSAACTAREQEFTKTNSNLPSNQMTVVESPQSDDDKKTRTVDYFAHLRPEHREVLRRFLKSKPFLRPGVEEIDSSLFPGNDTPEGNMKFLRDTVGEKGYQYYSVGDMNQDGKTDFAVLLVDTREQDDGYDRFALAIFNAPFEANGSPAYFEDKLHDISNCYIVFDRMERRHLYLGKLESDVYCATYYSKGKTYTFKDCLE